MTKKKKKTEAEQIQELQDTGRAVNDLIGHKAWEIARKKLTDKIVELQWIGNIQGATPEQRDLDMQAKQIAVDILYSFLAEVEGEGAQYKNNQELVDAVKEEIYTRVDEI